MSEKITLKQWLMRQFILISVLLVVIMCGISVFSKHVLKKQAALYNEGLVSVYIDQLDRSIEGITRFLSQYLSSTYDISTLAVSTDPKERYFAQQNIARRLKQEGFIYNTFDGIFFYSRSPVENVFLCQLGENSSNAEQEDFRAMMEDDADHDYKNGWQLFESEDRKYLMNIVTKGSSSVGVWLNLESMSLPLNDVDFGGQEVVLFTDREGHILSMNPKTQADVTIDMEKNGRSVRFNGNTYLQVIRESQWLPISIAIMIPDTVFERETWYVQSVILLFFGVLLCILPLLWGRLNKFITRPVNRLLEAMGQVQSGDFTARVENDKKQFDEFSRITKHFNRMVTNICQLKEDVYDRQIREQKTQLQYLQLQIRPHFFLNILNVIYSFSLVGRNDLIEKLTISLSKYFRYMFRSNVSFVTLKAECEHIKNYMDIQKLRYSGKFEYHQDIDAVLLEARIPPLVIQTFIENSIKYASDPEHFWAICLSAETLTDHEESKLRIVISDNGKGYPKDVLDAIDGGFEIDRDPEKRIGIINVKQRLNLMYGKRAGLKLYNRPEGGAVSEIILPLILEQEESTC